MWLPFRNEDNAALFSSVSAQAHALYAQVHECGYKFTLKHTVFTSGHVRNGELSMSLSVKPRPRLLSHRCKDAKLCRLPQVCSDYQLLSVPSACICLEAKWLI